ncbi:hypothetical protein KC622_03270, partial [Candidatus Dojkabacteria bacterium]|nr:hypothetical protein [Candidatus Dojkabacteria bacterium]
LIEKNKITISLTLLTLFVCSICYLILTYPKKSSLPQGDNERNSEVSDNVNNYQKSSSQDSPATKAGKLLSNGRCSGEGSVILSVSPMKPEDFGILLPYGLMVGGHVTPIDHQYFTPIERNSPRDAYEVRAMADGTIVDIGPRARTNPDDPNDKFTEYRIVFSHTCTFLTYYDLVTELSPELLAEYNKTKNADGYDNKISFPVKAGQVIGKIGGQTLDFAVWNTETPLTGFINNSSYDAEQWKIYTSDPYLYLTDELKQLLTERNPRTAEPIAGKIDYDQEGKLIGNWFEKGTGGYNGGQKSEYWTTHLAVVPNAIDPSAYVISFGDYDGTATQFTSGDDNFDPKKVTVKSGLEKVDLVGISYLTSEGMVWDQESPSKNVKLVRSTSVQGNCVLFKLLAESELKMETFPGTSCASVTGFTNSAKLYER